ncbi:MAG: YidB family protein [Escherichia coli]|nr:YidB family protein [Escherichia coli]
MGLFDEVVGAFLKGDAGKNAVSDLGQKLGVDTSTASSLLAEQLPKIIDALSPQGEVSPQANNDLLSAGMELLKGKLFR